MRTYLLSQHVTEATVPPVSRGIEQSRRVSMAISGCVWAALAGSLWVWSMPSVGQRRL